MYALITKFTNNQNLKEIYKVEVKERMNLDEKSELVIVQTLEGHITMTSLETFDVSKEGMHKATIKARAIAVAHNKSL